MKAFLMDRDRDFNVQAPWPHHHQALVSDLGLNALLDAMAGGDEFIRDVAKKALLSGLNNDLDTIRYRQSALQDCLNNPTVVRAVYDLAVESIEKERTAYYFSFLSKYPDSILRRAIEVLQVFVGMLQKLKTVADGGKNRFTSEGFTKFFTMLDQELDAEYFDKIQNHLKELRFQSGVLISAELGKGNKGARSVLRKAHGVKMGWMKRIFAYKPPVYAFSIHERDESGARALSELRDRGINLVANALAQSTDHILSFFRMLRTELAFYVGGLNLFERLARKGERTSFPRLAAPDERRHTFHGLYDVCLALNLNDGIVPNDMKADDKDVVIITGANQGGKTTFLRSVGLSQLMMQCGMFVPAESFCSSVCDQLFTHFKREEDVTMKSGKLDEELGRMSDIVDQLTPNSMLLLNETFAATNEREGSEISRQIIGALSKKRIRIFFVTHLYEFAYGFFRTNSGQTVFLRAERRNDGGRTFRMIEGEPLRTGYGEDLYHKIFGAGQ